MRFCPGCGTAIVPDAKFCVECGLEFAAVSQSQPAAAAARPAVAPRPPSLIGAQKGLRFTAAFVGVFVGILIIGLVAALLIMRHMPARRANQEAARQAAEGLPPGHPKIQLPQEARDYIKQLQARAKASPNDTAAWDKLGDVTMRAALFDNSYYVTAEDAYARVLKVNPNDADALRGIGNIYYDHRDYDQAVAAYEHYLKLKPADPDVLTDLGTMYLYQGNPDQAIVKYNQALKVKPGFFGALFNLGMAYGAQGKVADAEKAFKSALPAAPDTATRNEVKQMLAEVSAPINPRMDGGASASGAGVPSAVSASPATAGLGAKTFQGGFEQMVRALPVFGLKVQSVDWPSKNKAEVKMANFPMDAMPPFARRKLLSDLRSGLANLKEAHNVSGAVEVDIEDAASGRVMQTVTE